MFIRLLFYFMFFLFCAVTIFPQQSFQPQNNTDNFLYGFTNDAGSPDSVVSIIVEFVEEPFLIARQNSVGTASALLYENRFVQFENDVRGILSKSASVKTRFVNEAQQKFYKAFFGVSIQISQQMIPYIEQLPYVKKVHENKTVSAFLEKSIKEIRVNEVWSNYGLKGDGIVIGIIDSGIDYLHPALGGGFGPSFKVLGGYDFVNGDNDPMDDNGHGTHVAGIASANAVNIQGVAPEAKLYALKVLDEKGNGNMENVIAAIEYTVDPNGDGEINDRLDVVNISLGSNNGDPDDATSTAVDNATKLGVTFCISAGNNGNSDNVEGKEGNYYYNGSETIGSPGTARLAITVGAIDSLKKLAYFSSKGPTRSTFGIKPEVVAPGVNILSLAPGNSYAIKSGTSMAAPMITGIAALLKSKNRDLSPLQIKSAIVNSSVDLGLKIMHQGAGKADAMRAIINSTFAEPSQVSFGLDDPTKTVWVKVDTIKITNANSVSQNYSMLFSDLSAGVTLSASPQNFSLAAGEVKDIQISVTVNNSIVPIVNEDIIVYSGLTNIRGTIDTLHIPWSFARTTRMILSFSEPGVQFVGSGNDSYITGLYNKYYSKIRWLDSKNLEVAGVFFDTFDFVVYFPNSTRVVIKEGLQFTGNESYSFDASEAIHTVHFDGVDNNNTPFAAMGNTKRNLRINLPLGFVFAPLPDEIKTINVSPASGRFSFQGIEAFIDLHNTKKIFLPQYPIVKGLSGDFHFTNAASAYYNQTLKFKLRENTLKTRLFSDIISIQKEPGSNEQYLTIILGADTLDIVNDELSFELYLMKNVDESYSNSISFHTNPTYETDNYIDISTRYFTIVNDSIKHGFASQSWYTTYKSPNGGTMIFGDSPIFILNLSYNNSFGTSVHFDPMFRGALSEDRYNDINYGKYSIYNSSGVKIKEEALNVFPRYPLEVEPGKYILEIVAQNYMLNKAKGTLKLITNVDLASPVPDEPRLTSFMLFNSKNIPANNFRNNEKAELVFSAKTYALNNQLPVDDSTKVFYREFKKKNWLPLEVVKIAGDTKKEGSVYTISLAAATVTDSTAIDLKIRVVAENGNSTEQILSPAFTVGNWIDDGSTPVDDDDLIPDRFALHQNYPNPFNPETVIKYSLPKAGQVELKIFNVLGEEIALLVNEKKEAGNYSVNWNAGQYSSGVYLYRISYNGMQSVKKMILLR